MGGQKTTRRQKDISRLLREKQSRPPRPDRGKKPAPFRKKTA
ncbi:MAG: hypothetical protein PHG54_04410 [Smithellaceae bacterium]|nr:hypothetical protein [Smithellaceae bacterium]